MHPKRTSRRVKRMNLENLAPYSSEESDEDQWDKTFRHIKQAPRIFDPMIECIYTRKIK